MNSSNSTLKSKETVKSLEASVNAFSRITGVPVTYYDNSGAILKEYSPERKICGKFKIYSRSNSKCRSLLKFAGNFSSGLGEPYIFFCRAGHEEA